MSTTSRWKIPISLHHPVYRTDVYPRSLRDEAYYIHYMGRVHYYNMLFYSAVVHWSRRPPPPPPPFCPINYILYDEDAAAALVGSLFPSQHVVHPSAQGFDDDDDDDTKTDIFIIILLSLFYSNTEKTNYFFVLCIYVVRVPAYYIRISYNYILLLFY